MNNYVSDAEAALMLSHPNEYTKAEQDLLGRYEATRAALLDEIEAETGFCNCGEDAICRLRAFAARVRKGENEEDR